MNKKRFSSLSGALLLLTTLVLPSCSETTASSSDEIVLNVYNSADYIKEDSDEINDESDKGLVHQFEDYCEETYHQKVHINYSTFDTNETMLSELKTGKADYDLINCSDYVVQKMINEDMIIPFDDDSTPNYDKYVSPFVNEKIDSISVNGEQGIVGKYARGYMWGTLGILYNDSFKGLEKRGITSEEMEEDMTSWDSLWDPKYKNLLSIKDSVRDTYAVGIFETYRDDFTLEGKSYKGFATLKKEYEDGTISEAEYNQEITTIFNFCDDDTLNVVGAKLRELRDNAFGFEVDSGKVDMIKGDKFAINVAWSGDAAYAMDQADEYNASGTIDGEKVDTENKDLVDLRYALPETGANIWFDAWVMPKGANKLWASRFVDFLSTPKYAAENMEYIGYTPVIAGDEILELVQSWYDARYDEEKEEMDYSSITPEDEGFADEYYTKDISYFFKGTLDELDDSAAHFILPLDSRNKQFDTQYPDESLLPHLTIMADFGSQNASMLLMWESVKNTSLPTWAYYFILGILVLILVLFLLLQVSRHAVKKRRKDRKQAREEARKLKIQQLKKQEQQKKAA